MSLDELKQKWFIDTAVSDAFPPQERHPDSNLGDHSDGNLVKPLIDGANIMGHFDQRAQELLAVDDPSQCKYWLAGMGIEPVKLHGVESDSDDAISLILQLADAGVDVKFLASGQTDLGSESKKFAKKLIEHGGQGAIDLRIPKLSGQHQKFRLSFAPDGDWEAVVSSADFFTARWDTSDHAAKNRNRPKPIATHDMGLLVRGPAIRDIAFTFADRWNDLETSHLTEPPIEIPIDTPFLETEIAPAGNHSVQVLRSFPMLKEKGYSWSHKGEFTIWASYINAIKQAQKYVYIEDQYFYPLGDPPFIYKGNQREKETDFVYQLGEALKRGVDVVVLVPGRDGSLVKHYEMQHRRRATEYLHGISTSVPNAGRFVATTLQIGGKDPTIHAKVMLVDDEFASIGSANICQRSIAYISELQLGVVDAENELVHEMRLALWQEHLELEDSIALLDMWDAVGLMQETAVSGKGRLKSYPTKRYRFEFPYRFFMNRIVDPYLGPER